MIKCRPQKLKKWKIKKIYKKIWNDIVIKKREYFCNILQCHGPKIIGNRKDDKKIYKETNCQPDKNEKKKIKEWI